jgi:hypothetical protein
MVKASYLTRGFLLVMLSDSETSSLPCIATLPVEEDTNRKIIKINVVLNLFQHPTR